MTGTVLQSVSGSAADSSFSVGTLLMFVGGAILLAFFCSLGLIARIREHKLEQRAAAEATARVGSSHRKPDQPLT